MGELVNVDAKEIRLMSVEGRRVRILLIDDRVVEVNYQSNAALDHDLREWAAKVGYLLPDSIQANSGNQNDIAGFAP